MPGCCKEPPEQAHNVEFQWQFDILPSMTEFDWAQNRAYPFVSLIPNAHLQHAWDFSRQRWQVLQQAAKTFPSEVACAAVSGSLSRMEAHSGSDLDLLIIIDDRKGTLTTEQSLSVYSEVWKQLQQHDDLQYLKPPKPGGVFSVCGSWSSLINPAVKGRVAEDEKTFGQRMQLLLDSQPLFRSEVFEQLQSDLLAWYSESRIAAHFQEAGCFHWLWQDVHRYWRSIRSRACWLYQDQPQRSLEVNLKLRSSRLILIAAFLHAIAVAHRETVSSVDASQRLQQQLKQTPFERLVIAMPDSSNSSRLSNAWQTVWQHISTLHSDSEVVPLEIQNALQMLRRCLSSLADPHEVDWVF